jgi:membrane protein implicated in regulation of membrane protease activity
MNFWAQFLSFSGHSSIAYVFLARWPEKADTTSDRFAEDNDTMFIILRITNTI